MRSPPLVVLVLAALLPFALSATAEEPASPASRLETRLAALSAPSADAAFVFEGRAVLNGQPFGTIDFAAEPGDDGATWRVRDRFELAGGALVRDSVATLDRRLQPVRGRIEGKEPDVGAFEVTWERTEDGFAAKRVVRRDGEEASATKRYAHAGSVMSTMASLWLFARLTLPGRAEYASPVFDADPDEGEDAVETATWTQGEEGTWEGRKALFLRGRKGEREIEAAFDPETHDLLGTVLRDPSKGMTVEVRPATEAPDEEQDVFSRRAGSATEIALQAALGLATADLPLIERIFHWPSIHAQEKAKYDLAHAGQADAEPFPDVDAFRADTMAKLEQSLTANPRPMIEAGLKMSQAQIQTESVTGGFTKVTFPPMFRGLVMIVGEVDGAWHLVRLPTTSR